MVPLATSVVWPNLVCASSAPWDWVRCWDRRYRGFGLRQWCISKCRSRTAGFPTIPAMTWFPVQPLTARFLQPQESQESLLTPLLFWPFSFCFHFFFFPKVGSFPFLCPCLPSHREGAGRAIFLLLNSPSVKSMVWYRSLELYLQAQLERRARAGQARFAQELLPARYTVTQEGPSCSPLIFRALDVGAWNEAEQKSNF